jgi:EAL domain-containing protein (putative c-di-GMP-specific phosphodiesterase class I)
MPRRTRFESDLHRALTRGEFRLHYQPQVELQTGTLMGVEALLRWQHPGLGWLLPSDFMPVAEESGLIVALGARVVQEACYQGARWRAQRGEAPLRVAVNVSALQFGRADFVGTLTRALQMSGLPPELLTLEVTDSVIIGDLSTVTVGTVAERITELKRLGVRLSLDDFGTDYVSLAYLQHLPIDEVKVDRVLLSRLSTPNGVSPARDAAEDRAMVQAVISLARALHLEVVAEGVEDEAQLTFLRDAGCHSAQGYLLSPPVAAAAVPVTPPLPWQTRLPRRFSANAGPRV